MYVNGTLFDATGVVTEPSRLIGSFVGNGVTAEDCEVDCVRMMNHEGSGSLVRIKLESRCKRDAEFRVGTGKEIQDLYLICNVWTRQVTP